MAETPTLEEQLAQAKFQVYLLEQKLTYFPTPDTKPASEDLFKFLPGWRKRHELGEEEELFLLASLLAGRLGVHKSMVSIRKWGLTEDELAEAEECWPTPVPRQSLADGDLESETTHLTRNHQLAMILLERHIAKKQKEKPNG